MGAILAREMLGVNKTDCHPPPTFSIASNTGKGVIFLEEVENGEVRSLQE